jgi:predicted methyltransferase
MAGGAMMNRLALRNAGSVLFPVLLLLLSGCTTTRSAPGVSTVLANPQRPAADKQLDAARKPDAVVPFYGVKPGDKVADLVTGRGYYTAILSEVVGEKGMVYSASRTFRPEVKDRFQAANFANVRLLEGPLDTVALPQDASLDFVFIHLSYHDLDPSVRSAMNKRVFGALKKGGLYGVVDHSAKDGSGNEAVKTLHRIDRLLVIQEVTAAGFILTKEGNMLRRSEDPRDFNVNKTRNQDDRFVLAFQKP